MEPWPLSYGWQKKPLRRSQYAPLRATIITASPLKIVEAIKESLQEADIFPFSINGDQQDSYFYGGVVILPPKRVEMVVNLTFMSSGEDAFDSLHHYSTTIRDVVKATDTNGRIQWTELPYMTSDNWSIGGLWNRVWKLF